MADQIFLLQACLQSVLTPHWQMEAFIQLEYLAYSTSNQVIWVWSANRIVEVQG